MSCFSRSAREARSQDRDGDLVGIKKKKEQKVLSHPPTHKHLCDSYPDSVLTHIVHLIPLN